MLKSLSDWLQGLDDIIVGIKSVDNEQWTVGDEQCYNLAGQSVSQPHQGIFIMQNKKKIVK